MLFLWVTVTAIVQSDVVRVCARCTTATLDDAVRRASAGDTIVIEAGRYRSTHVKITKPLTIIGIGSPVLDGEGRGSVIDVHRAPVLLRGLVIENTGFSSLEEFAAVKFVESTGSVVEDVHTYRCAFGIALYNSPQSRLTNVRCEGTGAVESMSGNGLHLWKSPSCVIERCHVSHHRDGIYFEFSPNCRIESNVSMSNMRYGLHFMFSDSNRYRNNVFRNNGAGVAVMYSHAIMMEGNVFTNNWGPSSYGLLLKDIGWSRIQHNTFDRNTVGIHMEGTTNTVIANNTFRSNGWALKALGSCLDDTLECNTFVANTFDIMTNTYSTELVCRWNYWDQYRGYDLNRDGWGDVPYRPVSVFSILVERVPLAVLLLRSFVVDLLVYLERAIPSLIPVTMVDMQPQMVPRTVVEPPRDSLTNNTRVLE